MKHAAALLAILAGDSSGGPGPVDLSRFALVGSAGPLEVSTLSPSGEHVASYPGKDVKLIDARKGAEVRVLSGHVAQVHDSGWSRDGNLLATAGYDRKVRVWEVATGRELACVEVQSGYA